MAQIDTAIPAQIFEVTRNRIAEILADELDNQATLASNPDLAGPVFIERTAPFDDNELPAFNVSFDRGDYSNQNIVDVDGTYRFFIDAYTKSPTTDIIKPVPGEVAGEKRGDTLANFKLQTMLGVCRAILENPIYATLGFVAPFLSNKHVESIEIGKPKEDDTKSVVMGRLTFVVVIPEVVALKVPILIGGYDTQVKLELTDKGYVYTGDQ